jgi:hypothetical protein
LSEGVWSTALDGAAGVHSSGGDAWHVGFDEERTQTGGSIFLSSGPDRRGKVIRVQPAGDLISTKANTETEGVGYPFLFTVDDVEFPIWRFNGGCRETGDITPRRGFGDC